MWTHEQPLTSLFVLIPLTADGLDVAAPCDSTEGREEAEGAPIQSSSKLSSGSKPLLSDDGQCGQSEKSNVRFSRG